MEPISSEVLVLIIRQFHPGIHRGCFRSVKPLKMVYFQGLYEFTRGYVIIIYIYYIWNICDTWIFPDNVWNINESIKYWNIWKHMGEYGIIIISGIDITWSTGDKVHHYVGDYPSNMLLATHDTQLWYWNTRWCPNSESQDFRTHQYIQCYIEILRWLYMIVSQFIPKSPWSVLSHAILPTGWFYTCWCTLFRSSLRTAFNCT